MTADLHILHTSNNEPPEVDNELVDLLEGLVKQAKSGELQGIAYATIQMHADGTSTTASGWIGGKGTRHPLCSAISIIHQRYVYALWNDP